jgi:hypothetical protein
MEEYIQTVSKAVITMIVGRTSSAGKGMGHAERIIGGSSGSAMSRTNGLEEAGAKIANDFLAFCEPGSEYSIGGKHARGKSRERENAFDGRENYRRSFRRVKKSCREEIKDQSF